MCDGWSPDHTSERPAIKRADRLSERVDERRLLYDFTCRDSRRSARRGVDSQSPTKETTIRAKQNTNDVASNFRSSLRRRRSIFGQKM